MKTWIPWLTVAVFAAWLLGAAHEPPQTSFHTREFGQLPVQLNGRIQPFDSVARNSLLQINGRQSVQEVDTNDIDIFGFPKVLHTTSADDWLVELMMKPEAADALPAFEIDNLELRGQLHLSDKLNHFSMNDLRPHMDELEQQAQRIDKIEAAQRSVFERQLLKLFTAAELYQRLKLTLAPPDSRDFAAELAEYQKLVPDGVAAVRAREAGQKYDEQTLDLFLAFLSDFDNMSRFADPKVIPPLQSAKVKDDWQKMGADLMEVARGDEMNPATKSYVAMVTAYQNNRTNDFNAAVDQYHQWLGQWYPANVAKGARESFYNFYEGFYKAIILYVLAFLLAIIALLTFAISPNLSETLRRCAFYIIILAGALHTAAILCRMGLEGRPPVTNLYSSAIFIGWGCLVLGLALESFFSVGLGCAVASFAGFVTLVIAHNLAIDSDTMEMLRAVLDSNFWLSTHVLVVTLGYASTFVAGLLAITYILLGLFTPLLAQKSGGMELGKVLSIMVYAIVCFATLFSFVGTVLGGIWADQSWGRFWGWDPKENGALLIVIWNAIILHCRWGGIVRERGIMNLAVFGNIVTSFSWFGVNMLGIGLHSYGFMEAAFKWLALFIASQVAIIILGLLPKAYWKSFQAKANSTAPESSAPLAKAKSA